MQSSDIFFDLRLKKKHPKRRWLETPPCSLRPYCNNSHTKREDKPYRVVGLEDSISVDYLIITNHISQRGLIGFKHIVAKAKRPEVHKCIFFTIWLYCGRNVIESPVSN